MTQAHDWGCAAAFVNLGTEYDLQEGATGCSFTCMYECVHKSYLYICVYFILYVCSFCIYVWSLSVVLVQALSHDGDVVAWLSV